MKKNIFRVIATLLIGALAINAQASGIVSGGSGVVEKSFIQNGTGAVARTFAEKAKEVVSVKDFGAKGDGSNDDTAAIQAALNTSYRVYMPQGNYKITSSIQMTTYGAKLYGDGPNRTVIVAALANAQAVWIHGNYADTNSNDIPRNIELDDLSISGVGSSGTSVGIEIGQAANITVKNVIVHDFAADGILLKRPNHLFNIKLDTVTSISNGGYGVRCDTTNEVYLLNITNSWFSANGTGAAYLYFVGASISGTGFAGSPIGLYLYQAKNGSFSGDNFEANSTYDIKIDGAQEQTFASPRFIGGAGAIPVYMQSTGLQGRQITFENARFVSYTLSGAGQNVFKIIDAYGLTIGKYYLETCTMGGNAEVSIASPYNGTGYGNNYWDTSLNDWHFVPSEIRVNNWIPTITGLTNTGGAPSISGSYTKIGRIVYWRVKIQPVTNTSATQGSTVVTNLPYTAYTDGGMQVINTGTLASIGNGAVAAGTNSAYVPSWTNVSNGVELSGWYETSQ